MPIPIGRPGTIPSILGSPDRTLRPGSATMPRLGGVTGANSAVLTWDPPTKNADGTPLKDLAGYRIRYGKTASAMDNVVDVTDASANGYAIANLAAGTWYFGITAYDKSGNESSLSNVVSKVIR
jgi:hypothetical protein